MSLYKSGQVRDIPELNISFHDDNFCVNFLCVKDANSVIFSVDFLLYSLSMFCGIIGIEIQVFNSLFGKKLFCKKLFQTETGQLVSIADKRHI